MSLVVLIALMVTVTTLGAVAAYRAPRMAWARVGQSRVRWIGLQLMGLLAPVLLPISAIASILFLVRLRPRLYESTDYFDVGEES